MFFRNWLPMFYYGPKKARRRKVGIFLGVLTFSLIGFIFHVSSVWRKTAHSLPDTISTLFDDLGLNLLVGLATYLAFEIAFQSIDKKYGLLNEFSYSELVEDMQNIERKSEIKFLSIFFRVFTKPVKDTLETEDKYEQRIIDFEETKNKFINILLYICKNNRKSDKKVKVYMLLLDPISLAAKQRRKEMIDAKIGLDILEEIIKTLKELISINMKVRQENTVHKNVQMMNVRLYDRTPPFSLFKIDDRYSFSFYPRNQTIQDADHWSFYDGTPFQKFVTNNFNEVWQEDSTFDLEQYMYTTLYASHDNALNYLDEIYYIDYFQKEIGWFPDRKFIIVFPNRDQAKILSSYIDSNNDVTLNYRSYKRIRGRVYPINEVLAELKQNNETEAMDRFRDLAFDKYPADLIAGPTTRTGDAKLILIEHIT